MERLQKVMAEAGVASRRASEKLIATGHVQVNGQTVTTLGTKVTAKDKIEVDGVPLHREKQVYYLLNKPRGVISSAHDEKGRRTVVDILREDEIEERIYPVGRLDYDTTGLLLLTNDGALANKMMHPKFAVDKTYVAKVKGLISNDDLKQLRTGVKVDGRRTKPAKTRLKGTDREKKTSIVQLTIHEGHYHQVKRMLAAVGHPVIKLHRESYGFLNLQGVQPGDYRELRPEEVKRLNRL
ncbi:MAG: rRNA pseudouridine synthase [Limosilactobacillus oris]|jgi:23S rRNA pseudouridine2605 synthase|uniref:pseudouridine synthase n=1 Tax=Limosilactobacillus oris TaxID=1632 RepID=UPI000789E9FE|nr:pseudouridine synthase [Limosilactobacillus oris]AMS08040.1 pseudouridine synthase [Limosilactobacillus oris]MBF0600685.1 rRNA pseudouridine synthase [Limosilactobacillus oris]MCH3911765.1 rRNA pseudouridine synthase [Limosilactobacillus oris]MCH3939016.1 rRNA pseudouridine synthase [Limosilactobacillus oris]MCI1979844.1 rRNA pseudouridine synthase [Limosilactobacillus oris]